jgi:hypothetical protein
MSITTIPVAEYVYLGNNPNARMTSGWSGLSGRTYDIADWDYGLTGWSTACNFPTPKGPNQAARIAAGSQAPVARSNGGWGHVAALAVFTGRQDKVREPHGLVTYAEAMIWTLPREWWIHGADIASHRSYPSSAPFVRRRRNGERLTDVEVQVIRQLLGDAAPAALDWWDMMSAKMKAIAVPLGRGTRKKLPHHLHLAS